VAVYAFNAYYKNGIRRRMMLQILQTVNQDWDELKHSLRKCDREELNVLYSDIGAHFDDLKLTTTDSYTIIDEQGFVVAIFGVKDEGAAIGTVWMLSAERVAKAKKSLIKMTPQIREICFKEHKKLCNYVYKKNMPAIKYLQYVGAAFIKEKNIGDFLFFEIDKEFNHGDKR
jgi:hypothetical protein